MRRAVRVAPSGRDARSLRRALGLGLAAIAAVSCSKTSAAPGELMLSVQTDLQPGKDFDMISLRVVSAGETPLDADYLVASQPFPATLGIQVGSDPGASVSIRLKATKSGQIVALREVITSVPADRVALLRMPLQWLCAGAAKADTSGFVSSCNPGETCVEGQCIDEAVDLGTLPTYDPALVYGGGSGPGDGACFDTVGCFGSGWAVDVDVDTCTFAMPEGEPSQISVALVTSGEGICGPDACLVPLDAAGDWFVHDGRVVLPSAVCGMNQAPGAANHPLSVVVTNACAQKTAALPTCGPWSSVGTDKGTFDAGAPDGADGGLSRDGGSHPDAASDADGDAAADPCANGVKDGDETDVDCGGGTCPTCGPELACKQASDCDSNLCDAGTCACPADMVLSSRTWNSGPAFCIDKYEVTNQQYAAWLSASPDPAAQQDPCKSNADFVPAAYKEAGAPPSDTFPVTGVDWCDAQAYCLAQSRHLCGRVGSGGDPIPATLYGSAFNNPAESQWFDACSRGGARTFPYGTSYQAGTCNDGNVGVDVVDADSACFGGISDRLFDMSGNVAEWEASCDDYSGAADSCRVRGGSYKSTSLNLACAAVKSLPRGSSADDVGFRCCSY